MLKLGQTNLGAAATPASGHAVPMAAPAPVRFDRLSLLFCLLFPGILVVWFCFDHSWPFWDAADHVRVEFQYADLLRHARPWSLSWWHDFLTVNYCYPPTIHVFNGALKAALGDARWVDSLSLVIFSLILNLSACGIGLLLLRDRAAALLTVALLNLYPCVALLSHAKLLDYPHLSLYCLAMLSLLWWQRKPKPARAVATGVALALACTSKQIAAFFLFAPCLLLLITQIKQRQKDGIVQLLTAGGIVVCALALWFLPNLSEINAYMDRNREHLGGRNAFNAVLPNLFGYVNCLPGLTGYPLLALAVTSMLFCDKQLWRSVRLPALSALAGGLCLSLLPFQLPEHRYAAPALLFFALISAGRSIAWKRSARALFGLSAVLISAGAIQFFVQSFAPYPIPLSKETIKFVLALPGDRRGPLEPNFNPQPPGDPWGQQWVVQQCMKISGNAACWLNMLPSTAELSVHTLELVSRYEGSLVRPTTSRLWTPTGDKVDMPNNWSDFHFYLVKTGAQGLQFDSPRSAENYAELQRRLQEEDVYSLVAERSLPDGTALFLYAKKELLPAATMQRTTTETSSQLTDQRVDQPEKEVTK